MAAPAAEHIQTPYAPSAGSERRAAGGTEEERRRAEHDEQRRVHPPGWRPGVGNDVRWSVAYPDCHTSEETRSCGASLDRVWACHSPANYFTAYYRSGSLADCSAEWAAFRACVRLGDPASRAAADDAETEAYVTNHDIFTFRTASQRPPIGFLANAGSFGHPPDPSTL